MVDMERQNVHRNDEKPLQPSNQTKRQPNCNCCRSKACKACTILTILIFLIFLTLGLTLFKPKKPTAELLSATVEGVSPRITYPSMNVQTNLTLALLISVHNPNRVSFRYGGGKALLYYRGVEVVDVKLAPGNIPSRGSVTIPCKLVLEADAVDSVDLAPFLVSDIEAGEMGMDAVMRIAGRVKVVGIKKHVVVTSTCHFVVGLSSMKVKSQDCSTKTKL